MKKHLLATLIMSQCVAMAHAKITEEEQPLYDYAKNYELVDPLAWTGFQSDDKFGSSFVFMSSDKKVVVASLAHIDNDNMTYVNQLASDGSYTKKQEIKGVVAVGLSNKGRYLAYVVNDEQNIESKITTILDLQTNNTFELKGEKSRVKIVETSDGAMITTSAGKTGRSNNPFKWRTYEYKNGTLKELEAQDNKDVHITDLSASNPNDAVGVELETDSRYSRVGFYKRVNDVYVYEKDLSFDNVNKDVAPLISGDGSTVVYNSASDTRGRKVDEAVVVKVKTLKGYDIDDTQIVGINKDGTVVVGHTVANGYRDYLARVWRFDKAQDKYIGATLPQLREGAMVSNGAMTVSDDGTVVAGVVHNQFDSGANGSIYMMPMLWKIKPLNTDQAAPEEDPKPEVTPPKVEEPTPAPKEPEVLPVDPVVPTPSEPKEETPTPSEPKDNGSDNGSATEPKDDNTPSPETTPSEPKVEEPTPTPKEPEVVPPTKNGNDDIIAVDVIKSKASVQNVLSTQLNAVLSKASHINRLLGTCYANQDGMCYSVSSDWRFNGNGKQRDLDVRLGRTWDNGLTIGVNVNNTLYQRMPIEMKLKRGAGIGGFIHYQSNDWYIEAGYAHESNELYISRLADIGVEGQKGRTKLKAKAIKLKVGKDIVLSDNQALEVYSSLAHKKVTLKGYDEKDLAFPVSYQSIEYKDLALAIGANFKQRFTSDLSGVFGIELEKSLTNKNVVAQASEQYLGKNSLEKKLSGLRYKAQAGVSYSLSKAFNVSVMPYIAKNQFSGKDYGATVGFSGSF